MSLYQHEQILVTAAILCVVKKCIGKTKETRETSMNNLKSNQILEAHNINKMLPTKNVNKMLINVNKCKC